MITQIGITAGDNWNLLDKNKEMSYRDLLSQIDANKDTVLMSIGWLAREGHIWIEGDKDLVIGLRKKG